MNVADYLTALVFMMVISNFGFISLTIAQVVFILQGQKRSLYQEKLSEMQSGMITFMADVVENSDDNTGGHIKRTACIFYCWHDFGEKSACRAELRSGVGADEQMYLIWGEATCHAGVFNGQRETDGCCAERNWDLMPVK